MFRFARYSARETRFLQVLAVAVLAFWVLGTTASFAAQRVALVIGNAAYEHLPPLRTPPGDARRIAETLRAADFEVFVETDLDKRRLETVVRRFLGAMEPDGVSLLYYSGHAVQVGGHNHIIPVGARVESPYDLDIETMNVSHIIQYMRENSRVRLIFLDACRDNPFKGTRIFADKPLTRSGNGPDGGLASIQGGAGTLIAFSTEPGAIALDGKGGLSPFTRAFAKHAMTPAIDIRRVLSRVRRDVMEATAGQQIPWENSSLIDDFFLVQAKPAPVVQPLHKVIVDPAREMVDVRLPAPVAGEGGDLSLVFDDLPKAGRLMMGEAPVKTGERYPISAISKLRFSGAGTGSGHVELAAYRVLDNWGGEANGTIAIAISATGPSGASAHRRRDQSAPPKLAPERAVFNALKAAGANVSSIYAGVGAQPLGVTLTTAAGERACPHCIRVAAAPNAGLLRIGERLLNRGDRFAARDLDRLAYSLAREPTGASPFALEVVDTQGASVGTVDLEAEAKLHPCDTYAGEPLDLQGVAPGVLPNEIKVAKASAHCLAASADFPHVPRFLFQYGRAQYAGGNSKKARELFQLAANAGHIRAWHKLGKIAEYGAVGPVDLAMAARYFEKAATKGDPYGLYSLGKLMFYGRGVQMNRQTGLAMMLQGAEMGHTFAMNELGAIFRRGQEVEQDMARAVTYFSASTVREDIYGYNNLALVLLKGDGVPTDYKRALTLFLKADRGGHPDAANNIGRMYFNGWGVAKNVELAASWYEKAAWRGSAHGANNRAWIAIKSPAGADPALAARYWALAVVLGRRETTERARAALDRLPATAVTAAVQQMLKERDLYAGAIDGQAGAGTTRGLAEALDRVPAERTGQLIELVRQKWIGSRPRFDLL
jgi:TPR repeat protein